MSDEVRFNVLNHVNVPLHEVLSDEEASALLGTYGIVREQLPKIKNTDPAAKVIGAQAGNILRITRRSPTAGVATAYRLVIEAI
ncbi:MAG: DNA-directed RNA polymerase subunit H [Thermoplasmatota archaeon]